MFSKEKKYGIIGLARSGIAAAYKIKSLGGQAYLSDIKSEKEIPESEQLKADFPCEFSGHTDKLLNCDEWIVSPGIPLTAPIIIKGREHNIKMISELEFGFQIKNPHSKLIAVTGSNGKSTTASLIAHIIEQSGHICVLAGNIGDAFCGFPIEKEEIEFIVLEVSSFQLELIDTFRPDLALLLNITPDHLNRYDTFSDYAKAKFNIFRNQTSSDFAILNLDDPLIREQSEFIRANKRFFTLKPYSYTEIIPSAWLKDDCLYSVLTDTEYPLREMQLRGPHNWANAMAAILACETIGISNSIVKSGLESFTPLKHRLQFVKTINGISFYNDSKATNTDSVKYALLSFEQPIRIIMGGSEKGEDFEVLTDLLAQHAKKAYLTGATAQKMASVWSGKIPLEIIDDFEECIRKAFSEATAGDKIVLSPACASYDKFRNFEQRGDTFIDIVNKMAKEYEKA